MSDYYCPNCRAENPVYKATGKCFLCCMEEHDRIVQEQEDPMKTYTITQEQMDRLHGAAARQQPAQVSAVTKCQDRQCVEYRNMNGGYDLCGEPCL